MLISDCTQQNTGILLTTKSNVNALALLVSGPTALYQLTCTVKSRLTMGWTSAYDCILRLWHEPMNACGVRSGADLLEIEGFTGQLATLPSWPAGRAEA